MLFWAIEYILKQMAGFLFFTRVAVLLNLVFLLCVVLRYQPAELFSQAVVGVLLVGGWLLSFVVNITVSVWLLFLLLRGQKPPQLQVAVVFNVLLLIVQVVYFFLL